MRDFLGFICVIVVALVVLFGVSIGICAAVEHIDCNAYGRATSQEVKFDWGCYVKVDNQWIPKSTVVGKTVIIK